MAKVRIVKAHTPVELEQKVNGFLQLIPNPKIINISYTKTADSDYSCCVAYRE